MDIDNLDKRVKQSIRFVTVLSVAAPAVYMFWFWFVNHAPLSKSTESWGQLGDFLGGILNPLIAFSAFYWLATSVLIQKTELTETRNALEASQKAQEDHAKTVLVSTKLQYINIQLEAINAQVLAERAYINQLIQQAQTHGTQYSVVTRSGTNKKLDEILPQLNDEISSLSSRRDELIEVANSFAPELA